MAGAKSALTDFAKHVRATHTLLVVVCLGLLAFLSSTKSYSPRAAASQLALILSLPTPNLSSLYHKVERFSPPSPEDASDATSLAHPLQQSYAFGPYDPMERTPGRATIHVVRGNGTLNYLVDFPLKDWYQTTHSGTPSADPDRFPASIGRFEEWWNGLESGDYIDLTFASGVSPFGLLYSPKEYRSSVGTSSPTPDEVLDIVDARLRAHTLTQSKDLVSLEPVHNELSRAEREHIPLELDLGSFGAAFIGRLPNSDFNVYFPVTRLRHVRLTQQTLLWAATRDTGFMVGPALCAGDFTTSFPDLAIATQELDTLPLADAMKALMDEASRTDDTFEALGIKFPSARVTAWGTVVILALQLYLFTLMRRLRLLVAGDGTLTNDPWIGVDASPVARLLLLASLMILPAICASLLAETAIAQVITAAFRHHQSALAAHGQDYCARGITSRTLFAAADRWRNLAAICPYLMGALCSLIVGIFTWRERPRTP